jgi:hypothetical protein
MRCIASVIAELKLKLGKKVSSFESQRGYTIKLKPAEKYALMFMRNNMGAQGSGDQSNACYKLLVQNNHE